MKPPTDSSHKKASNANLDISHDKLSNKQSNYSDLENRGRQWIPLSKGQ